MKFTWSGFETFRYPLDLTGELIALGSPVYPTMPDPFRFRSYRHSAHKGGEITWRGVPDVEVCLGL